MHSRKYLLCAAGLVLTGALLLGLCALVWALPALIAGLPTAEAALWHEDMPALGGALAALAAPAGALLWGVLIYKLGPRRGLILAETCAALGLLVLVAALSPEGGVYGGYLAGLAVLGLAAAGLVLGVWALACAWSVRRRGLLLGLCAAGFCALRALDPVLEGLLTALGGDVRPALLALAGLLALLALPVRFLLRDRPEDAGLYPDGADWPPASEAELSAPALGFWGVFRGRRAWLLWLFWLPLCALAAPLLRALPAQTEGPWPMIGALAGVAAGVLTGLLDRRLGCFFWALALLGLTGLSYAALALADTMGLSAALVLGGALTGCLWTGLPCTLARAYGRRDFPAAQAALIPLAALCAAGPGLDRLVTAFCRPYVPAALGILAALALAGSVALRAMRETE